VQRCDGLELGDFIPEFADFLFGGINFPGDVEDPLHANHILLVLLPELYDFLEYALYALL
jgi:hypothetical protein